MPPLITIGITCFREGAWLGDCWNSVLAQTDPRWAAVVVLDGGADRATREVFTALEHPRLVKHAMAENVGPYPVRNRAFELTRTPYHFYLDGDDQLLPDSVRIVLEAFAEHPDASVIYGNYRLFGAREGVQYWPVEPTWDDYALGQPVPGPCAYAKSLWEELGGFAPELARGNGDYDLHIGALERGHVARHAGREFYRHRVGHGGRVSGSYERRYYETSEIIVRRHPIFFADDARRRRFLSIGYQRSLEASLAGGDLARAAEVTRLGVARGLWRGVEASGALGAGLRGVARLGKSAFRRAWPTASAA